MIAETQVGPLARPDGSIYPSRAGRTGELITADGHGRFFEPTVRGGVYSLTLSATTGTIAAGNIVAAAAAASTQFALFNPATSSKNLVLLKFGMGVISGTPPAGPIFHGFYTANPTIASIGGTIRSHNLSQSGTGSVALPEALAAGAALTGGVAPLILRVADFTQTATAAAVNTTNRVIELIDGDIVVPPGFGWVPLWSGAGTTLLNAYSIVWEEVAI